MAPEFAEKIETGKPGHNDVREHTVIAIGLKLFESFTRVGGTVDRKAIALKEESENSQNGGLVINDEHASGTNWRNGRGSSHTVLSVVVEDRR